MSDETNLAFAHPEERAKSLSPMRDRISVRDHIVSVEIGAFQSERDVTQRLAFNVVVEVADQSDTDDDVDRILSYDTITEAIEYELAAERLNLLETLAERVADRILIEPLAERVFVRIEKLDRGPGKLGVEIVRGAEHQQVIVQDTVRPVVLYLTKGALSSDNLSGWLDQLADRPAILCVDAEPAKGAVDNTKNDRITLLAVEQAAWLLSDRDPRCVVVGSRTELDWGLKHGQISVWAPSRIVIDTVENRPVVAPFDLAVWLAKELDAIEFISIGETRPANTQLPARNVSIDETGLF